MRYVKGLAAAIIALVAVTFIMFEVVGLESDPSSFIGLIAAIGVFISISKNKSPVQSIAAATGAIRNAKETIEEKLEEDLLPFYGIAEKEVEDGTIQKDLWAKALIQANGDEKLRKVEYIKIRAKALRRDQS